MTLKKVWYHCSGCEGHCDGGIGPVWVETPGDLPEGASFPEEESDRDRR